MAMQSSPARAASPSSRAPDVLSNDSAPPFSHHASFAMSEGPTVSAHHAESRPVSRNAVPPASQHDSRPVSHQASRPNSRQFSRHASPRPGKLPSSRKTWHTRRKRPDLRWGSSYSDRSLQSGRVFIIDYLRQDLSREGMRKVAAREINDIHALRRLYDSPEQRQTSDAVLRLIHVQDADWAVQFLLRKFYIKSDHLVGNDFGTYVKAGRPERRGGRVVPRARAWPTQHDPWRGLIKTAFGIDYTKLYKSTGQEAMSIARDRNSKLMTLNCYDEVTEAPTSGWDVYAQRICCYIQQREEGLVPPPTDGDEIRSPYSGADANANANADAPHRRDGYVPDLHRLDNNSTVIIFENSCTRSINDTCIPARQTLESRWRRLPFFMAYETDDTNDDTQVALQCLKLIVRDVWKAVAGSWDCFLETASHHVAILEDKIYAFPADESRADEIWATADHWLKTERTVWNHLSVLKEVSAHLKDLADDPSGADNAWVEPNVADFNRLTSSVSEDLVKPTANLSDLLYKSIGIRDTRHSLELSYSMWRLSWITFIFLPLTFTVSFFGMNVDTFAGDPSIAYFFAAAVPLMFVVLILWYLLKHQLARSRATPYLRSTYESLFHELATSHPRVWSRDGPLEAIRVSSRLDAWKWRLLRRWNDPDRTIRRHLTPDSDDFDGLGSWNRFKRTMTRRWANQLDQKRRIQQPAHDDDPAQTEAVVLDVALGPESDAAEIEIKPSALSTSQSLSLSPPAIVRLSKRLPSLGSQSRRSSTSQPSAEHSGHESSTGDQSSGVLVEEERTDWLPNS